MDSYVPIHHCLIHPHSSRWRCCHTGHSSMTNALEIEAMCTMMHVVYAHKSNRAQHLNCLRKWVGMVLVAPPRQKFSSTRGSKILLLIHSIEERRLPPHRSMLEEYNRESCYRICNLPLLPLRKCYHKSEEVHLGYISDLVCNKELICSSMMFRLSS